MYNNNWRLLDKEGKSLGEERGRICFASLRPVWEKNKDGKDSVDKVVIFTNRDKIDYKLLDIRKYVKLLNSIKCFKIEYDYDSKKKICSFTIDPKDYPSTTYWIGATMVIRYLWEKGSDHFDMIPAYFMELDKKYPDLDMLYKLLWAHAYLEQECKWYSSNHCLTDGEIFPMIEKNLKDKGWTNETFSKRTKSTYNKYSKVEDYYNELKELKCYKKIKS